MPTRSQLPPALGPIADLAGTPVGDGSERDLANLVDKIRAALSDHRRRWWDSPVLATALGLAALLLGVMLLGRGGCTG